MGCLQCLAGRAGVENGVVQLTNQVHFRVAEEPGTVAHHHRETATEPTRALTAARRSHTTPLPTRDEERGGSLRHFYMGVGGRNVSSARGGCACRRC